VKTTGDKDRVSSMQSMGTGIFTKELEDALLREEAHLAVHSLKDLPTEIAPGLALAGVLPRADWRDALVGRDGKRLAELPAAARLGTSSPRRRAQVLALRPDLQVEELRGNVETRLNRTKLPPSDPKALDAVLLARAGLDRLGKSAAATETFGPESFLPAPGQGAIGLETRAGDSAVREVLAAIDDAATNTATRAERLLHKLLGGGCHAPIGALGESSPGGLRLRAVVAALDGRRLLRAEAEGPDPARLARVVFEKLEALGAVALLAAQPK
jgi:hydroxymethylbilane synthase